MVVIKIVALIILLTKQLHSIYLYSLIESLNKKFIIFPCLRTDLLHFTKNRGAVIFLCYNEIVKGYMKSGGDII